MPRIWRALSCNAYMPYMPESMQERPPPLVFSGSLPPGAVLRSAMKTVGLAARHKAEILGAIDRQMRKARPWLRTGGIVNHQMVDVLVRNAGLGKRGGAGHTERARGGEILRLADHRRLDVLAGAEQVDRLLQEVSGTLGGHQDQRTAAIGDQTRLQ